MNVPPRVDAVLGGEDVAAHVPLKGEDALFVTPTRTLHYTAEGLLSDESVTEYEHDAERIEVNEGRRKAKIVLDYGLEGQAEIPVPGGKLNDALHPILAGVLNAAGVTEAGETVKRTYRFSELTLVVTSHRVVKHIGGAVWDEEFEEVPFADVTGLGVEEGNVASQLVLETTGRTQRIKAPNEEFRDVRETIENALFAFHDVTTAEEFRAVVGDEDAEPEAAGTGEVSFDAEPELETQTPTPGTVEDAGQQPGQESATSGQQSTQSSAQSSPQQPAELPTADSDSSVSSTEQASVDTDASAQIQESDALAESGFEKASSKVQPQIDTDAVRDQLDALEAELAEQETAIRAQREHLAEIRDLLSEE